MAGIPNAEAAAIKTNSAAAIMLGIIIGTVIVRKMCSGLAPDIRAASSSDGSIFSIAREIVINAYG